MENAGYINRSTQNVLDTGGRIKLQIAVIIEDSAWQSGYFRASVAT